MHRDEIWRRLAVTAAALLVFRLATHIPLYGIDAQALSVVLGTGSGAMLERISIGALGVAPIFSAVAIAELTRLLGPSRWRANWPSDHAPSWILWLALTFAAIQAGGIAIALEQVGAAGGPHVVVSPGAHFRAVSVVTLTATTALLWWLSGMITRHGLGSGMWWLLLAPFLVDLPRGISAVGDLVRTAAVPTSAILVSLAYAVLVVFVIVLLYRLLEEPDKGQAILWPSLLAPVAVGILLLPVGLISIVTSTDLMTDVSTWLTPGKATWLITILALTVVFILLRHWRDAVPAARARGAHYWSPRWPPSSSSPTCSTSALPSRSLRRMRQR